MTEEEQDKIYADVLKRLISHLQKRTDVQNIDLMILSGFCRNCLSKWYAESAEKKGLIIDYENARNLIYGMPYNEWKKKYQKDVSKDKLEKIKN